VIRIAEGFRKIIIKTGVDRLLELILENDGITVGEASRVLQIPKNNIESWGAILSKENLIDMKYETGGKITLNLTSKNLKNQQKEIEKLSKDFVADIDKIDLNLKKYDSTIQLNKDNISSFEQILNKDISKIENIEKVLGEFSKNKKELEESILKIKKEEDILMKKEDELENREKAIGEKEKELKDNSKDIIDTITQKLKIIDESHEHIVSLEKEKDRLREDLELIKKISRIIEKEKDVSKLHQKIDDVEERHKKLKDRSLILKMKFERFQEIVKKIFTV